MTTETGFNISEEPLAERVLRQVRSGQLDESRLLPSAEKRARDVGKKLDRLAARQGWYTFMAGQAYAVATGKAPSKRNAEVMAVEQVMRWRSEVSRFAPDRLAEFDELIAFVDTLWRDPHAGVTRPDTHGTWEDVSTPSEV